MSEPLCQVCAKTRDTAFNVFPITEGFKFGEICITCDVGDNGDCGCSIFEPVEACPTHVVQHRKLRPARRRPFEISDREELRALGYEGDG